MQTLGITSAEELAAADRYPISRWYARPCAEVMAELLSETWVQPSHVTLIGLLLALSAAATLVIWPSSLFIAATLVLMAWFCDRLDGALARRQRTASAWGAWFDANADEVTDLGIHAAVAHAASVMSSSLWPWAFYGAFVFGKYQLMHGLSSERDIVARYGSEEAVEQGSESVNHSSWLRHLYHLPANADVRLHLLLLGLLTGWLQAELFVLAVYYNLRWLARVGLVASRLGGPA